MSKFKARQKFLNLFYFILQNKKYKFYLLNKIFALSINKPQKFDQLLFQIKWLTLQNIPKIKGFKGQHPHIWSYSKNKAENDFLPKKIKKVKIGF